MSLRFSNENTPIEVIYEEKTLSTIYYGNSDLLNKLKYYPFTLVLIFLLFSGVVFFYYKSSKTASQNKLWTGMAKETAHQIGTPLSSLIGWTELLKSEAVNPTYISEIEKDQWWLVMRITSPLMGLAMPNAPERGMGRFFKPR